MVERLLRGQVGAVAWGRAEVGPRALGHRSLIALPGEVAMRDRVNTIKGRELWRPLAPIGTAEANGRFWEGPEELQRYMLGAATSRRSARSGSPRPCTSTARRALRSRTAPGFVCDVLAALGDAGADPVLINTSFNTRGEPIVNSADDAIRTAEAIGVDFLVLGETLL